ncbi:MAG: aldehyde dehydrogenase family protein [Oceanococcus sp.]
MNAVMQPNNTISEQFDQIALKAQALALTTIEERIAKLQRLLQAMLEAREEIIAAGQKELRVHETDIDGQLLMVKAEIEFICKHLGSWMQPQPVQGSLMTLGKKSYVRYEPKGVVLHVSTWNAPIAEAFVMGAGAIAAGNAFILKPSELAPESAAVISNIVAKAFAADEFAVFEGGADVAQALMACRFNHVFYIGGHGVGRLIMKAAADHFATVTLEMGGKNPTIIDASADVDDAAFKTAWARAANAGQVCVAPDYALVHESIVTSFVDKMGKAFTEMYNPAGEGFQTSNHLPRIVNSRHFERITGLLQDALDKGAKLEFGGETDANDLFISPTILSNVNEDMRIMQEEVFGPIICIVPFQQREDAEAIIRRRPKPLSLYVFAKDRLAIDWFISHTTSGSTVVNHNVIQSGTNPQLAFGGVNDSGMGRVGGKYTFLECSNPRSIVEDGPPVGDPKLMFPPYSDKYKKMVGDMLKRPIIVPDAVVNAINGMIKIGSIFRKS